MGKSTLRQKLIDENLIPYVCKCGNEGTWLGEPLKLQLDHIDGDNSNDEIENLRFLCPNCHSQTPTFCRVKGRASITTQELEAKILKLLPTCKNVRQIIIAMGMEDRGSTYSRVYRILSWHQDNEYVQALHRNARSGPRFSRRKVERPTKDELEKLIWSKPSTQLAKDLGLKSSNSLTKWCREVGISKPPRGYWMKLKFGKAVAKV